MYFNNHRKSAGSLSATTSTSSLDESLREMTLPLAPREDDYNMSEKQREARLISKCKRAEKAPWKNAKPLPVSSG